MTRPKYYTPEEMLKLTSGGLFMFINVTPESGNEMGFMNFKLIDGKISQGFPEHRCKSFLDRHNNKLFFGPIDKSKYLNHKKALKIKESVENNKIIKEIVE